MKINSYIEHTLLKPDATTIEIKELCQEALDNDFAAVCVPPYFVKTAAKFLENYPIKIVTPVGYPMGYHATSVKVEEAKRAINDGVHELEIVVNIGAIKDGSWVHVKNDIDSVTTTARLKNKKIRVVVETSLLTGTEIIKLCDVCKEINVDYIKNATGVNSEKIPIEMIAFLKENADSIKIIAVGNVDTKSFAQELLEVGASLISTSSAIQIVK